MMDPTVSERLTSSFHGFSQLLGIIVGVEAGRLSHCSTVSDLHKR